MKNGVFCNRTLNMKRINYIGLDMDHTLVRYKSENFEALAHRTMREKLVHKKGYPKSILNLGFDFKRAIRGLIIDKAKGNILKLSRHTAIRTSYHGLAEIDFKTQKKIYKSTYIDIKDKNYDKVDTTFSIAFATLYAQLVDLKKNSETPFPDFMTIADDLNEVLDEAHRDDSLKSVVRENLSQYIVKDAPSVRGIERFLKHGKKFFIVTNSDFQYAKVLLDYAITPLAKGSKTWQDLFSYVIVSARKPSFFFEDTQFEHIDPDTGGHSAAPSDLPPGCYYGGNANTFTAKLGLEPDEILYIGDHIYGDVVRLKKDCAWRTALIVEELDHEIKCLLRARPYSKRINALMAKKIPLEVKIDNLISKKIELGGHRPSKGHARDQADAHSPTKARRQTDKHIEELIKKSSALDQQIAPLIKKQLKLFNPYWGEVMRVGIEESYFAYQVERFACIYMARLSHLLGMSPRTYFRSIKRPLPHELL